MKNLGKLTLTREGILRSQAQRETQPGQLGYAAAPGCNSGSGWLTWLRVKGQGSNSGLFQIHGVIVKNGSKVKKPVFTITFKGSVKIVS